MIMSYYTPLHLEIYTLNENFFVPSFLKAINENHKESFQSIITEPCPGVLIFQMLKPSFCKMLLAEVENFKKWAADRNFTMMRPTTMNKYGAVLDDFGLEIMLDKLMKIYLLPIAKVFFPEVGGSTLDSHHGFVVEYGTDKDIDLGFHVDDSEVTLNVCLGKQFAGGELFFESVRCEEHIKDEIREIKTKSQDIMDFSHVPGHAIVHRGRHLHGARATTSGHRINMLLWCRRELKKYEKSSADWCGHCRHEKKERQRQQIAALKQKLLKQIVERLPFLLLMK